MLPEKIIWGNLRLEMTRRCNMRCAHCMRGEAQNVDMAFEVMDSVLDKTSKIEELFFSGGEPTLYLEGWKYFLDGMKKRNIPLYGFSYTTNGSICTDELAGLLSDYADYVRQFIDADVKTSSCVHLEISKDKYHDTGTADKAFRWYMDNVKGKIGVTYHRVGEITFSAGRAKELPYSLQTYHEKSPKLGYFTKEKECLCIYRKSYRNLLANEIAIPCMVCISAYGNLMRGESPEWDNNDIVICNMQGISTGEVVSQIDSFNEGRRYCLINDNSQRAVDASRVHDSVAVFQAQGRREKMLIDLYKNKLKGVAPSEIIKMARKKYGMKRDEVLAILGYYYEKYPDRIKKKMMEEMEPAEIIKMEQTSLQEAEERKRFEDWASALSESLNDLKKVLSFFS